VPHLTGVKDSATGTGNAADVATRLWRYLTSYAIAN